MAIHNKINHEENIGKQFYKLKVLEVTKKGKDFYYICRCDCGKVTEKRASFVLNGDTKSCGCLQHEVSTKLAKTMGLKNRKYNNICTYCGVKKHYAKGLCKKCYIRLKRNGTIEYKRALKNK